MYLYHYFEKERGPFLTLSDLPDDEIKKLLNQFRKENNASGNKTVAGNVYSDDNIITRRGQEYMTRITFIEKGGKPVRQFPIYMVLANDSSYEKAFLHYYHNRDYIKIPVNNFDMTSVSFTYGDQCQTVDPREFNNFDIGKYRPPVYTFDEILEVINQHGWIIYEGYDNLDNPTFDWNRPWYIEAQVWSDDNVLKKYR
jgi:hypothetical protein